MDPAVKIFHTFLVHKQAVGLRVTPELARVWVWDEERIPVEDDVRLLTATKRVLSSRDDIVLFAEGFHRFFPRYMDFEAPDETENGVRVWRDREWSPD